MEYKHLKIAGPLARPAVDEAMDEHRAKIKADMEHAALVSTLRAGETPKQAKRRRARLGIAETP